MNIEKSKGFTLVEVAIVLLIGGLIIASASAALKLYIENAQIKTTRHKIEKIDEALQLFLSLNGRYPCPALPDAGTDTAEFGFEQFTAAGGCQTTPVAAGRNGRPVRYGAVPVRTLSLPDGLISDEWAGRFTYAVTESLAEQGTFNRREGAIIILDSEDNPLAVDTDFPPGDPEYNGTAHYVIVSHGEDGKGSVSAGGGGAADCLPANHLDAENCNGDATFRNTLLKGTADNDQFYDDHIAFKSITAFGQQIPSGAVVPFNLVACPDGWVQFSDGDARFIVGADGTEYNLNDTGGENEIALSNPEIGLLTIPGSETNQLPGGGLTVPQGGGAASPHENRPPYIALLYCEKT